jgi:hypothetical protein
MASPTRVVIERTFWIALTPAVAANLPTIRLADVTTDTYGLPSGSNYYMIQQGDVITDATLIATFLGLTPAQIQTAVLPGPSLPKWSAF